MKKFIWIFLLIIAFTSEAQITLNSDVVVAAQKSADGKQYTTSGNKHVPYASPAQFLSTIPSTRRHLGEIAYIYVGSRIETWHFVGGIADSNFVRINYPSYLKYPLYALNDSTAAIYVDSVQTYTTGTTLTVNNYVDVLLVNPATEQASLTITLPDTASYKNHITIVFGGDIAYGDTVITSLTITGPLIPPFSEPITSGTVLKFKLVADKWYME